MRIVSYNILDGGEGFTPEDVVTTIYSLLGINVDRVYRDHLDRPWKIATGTPIRTLLA